MDYQRECLELALEVRRLEGQGKKFAVAFNQAFTGSKLEEEGYHGHDVRLAVKSIFRWWENLKRDSLANARQANEHICPVDQD